MSASSPIFAAKQGLEKPVSQTELRSSAVHSTKNNNIYRKDTGLNALRKSKKKRETFNSRWTDLQSSWVEDVSTTTYWAD